MILCTREDDEVDVIEMWDKIGALKTAFPDEPLVKQALQGTSIGSPKAYLAVVSTDSSISYYYVDQRSLSLEASPK